MGFLDTSSSSAGGGGGGSTAPSSLLHIASNFESTSRFTQVATGSGTQSYDTNGLTFATTGSGGFLSTRLSPMQFNPWRLLPEFRVHLSSLANFSTEVCEIYITLGQSKTSSSAPGTGSDYVGFKILPHDTYGNGIYGVASQGDGSAQQETPLLSDFGGAGILWFKFTDASTVEFHYTSNAGDVTETITGLTMPTGTNAGDSPFFASLYNPGTSGYQNMSLASFDLKFATV